MEDNFYIRGDGTRVYFFTEEELKRIWRGASLFHDKHKSMVNQSTNETDMIQKTDLQSGAVEKQSDGVNDVKGDQKMLFEIASLGVDRRMLVNRKKELKMYRCWMQARFKKPSFR